MTKERTDIDESQSFGPDLRAPGLATVLRELREPAPEAGRRLRIRVLRSMTCEDLAPFLRWRLRQSGIEAEISFGDFGVIMPELISYLETPPPYDLILLALSAEDLAPDLMEGRADAAEAIADLSAVLEATGRIEGAVCVINSLAPIQAPPRAQATRGPNAPDRVLRRLNDLIQDHAAANPGRLYMVDVERILQELGRPAAINPRMHYEAAAPYTHRFMSEWARALDRIARAHLGMAKKVLVLDCDGVLWGGVIGEDGLDGVRLGPETAEGRIHLDFQRAALDLQRQGALIALCSKNEEEDVWRVLDHHPHSAIRREHVAAWRVNWEDKAANIRALAEELNLGLESVVFIDDSAFECALVASLLPEVTVRRVPETLAELPLLPSVEGLFDKATLSAEDSGRTALYRAEAERKQASSACASLDAYLAGLGLWAKVAPARPETAARISQLTQKTNQFNLTTERCDLVEIEARMADPNRLIVTLEAGDRFGALGVVGLALFRREAEAIALENLLMSCRALGRGLEKSFLGAAMGLARARFGLTPVAARYRPTPKNPQVEDFLDGCGFEMTALMPDGAKDYLSRGAAPEPAAHVALEIEGRADAAAA